MSGVLIKNGHIIDPANERDEIADILVEDGHISKVEKNISCDSQLIIDAKGLVVTPGLVDLQVHMREPGREDRETIETASRAALAGGVTTIVAMPNTTPPADNQSVIEFIINRARELDLINVFPAGTITKGQQGNALAEIQELKNSGAVAITDDGVDVKDEGVLRRAMEYAHSCDMPVMSHCETESLTNGGVMHEGWISTYLGLPGVPAESEDLAVIKNIMLAELTGVQLHLLHNSTKGAGEAIRKAKEKGRGRITAEVSVQHFALSDEECLGYTTNAKMYPPLRSKDHIDAIIQAIKDDVFDAFTTDHAPHIEPDKLMPFEVAAFGSTGLETSFAVMNTYLVDPGHIPLSKGISKMTYEPARILGLPAGTLSEGAQADIALFDIDKKWKVNSHNQSFSKGKNCIFNDKILKGKAVMTFHKGQIRYQENA